jgi:peptidoglycan/LPS O-acetylase OafA/YrhL
MFFTLSGYLITDLLLSSYARTGRLPLREFWARRARRLLPALLVMLAVVSAWITVAHRAALPGLRGAVLSAVGFVGNWWLIVQNVSYFDRFAPPTPLGHLWSLAVEEQFYLVWPWVLLGALWLARRRRQRGQVYPGLAVAAFGLTAASAVWMALLYQPGFDNTRAYDGTDTRAFGFLVGAALALVWPSQRLNGPVAAGKRWALDAAGATGLAAIVALIVGTDEYSPVLYRGGLVALSVATAVVVAVAAHPASWLGRALGSGPLRWLGVRSYGIYLWHLPVIVLTGAAIDTGRVDLPRAGLQIGASIGLAALSWRYVEQPIRHGALGRLCRRRRRLAIICGWAWTVPTAAVAVVSTACVGLADSPSPTSGAESASTSTGITVTAPKTPPTTNVPSRRPTANARRPSAVPVATSCATVTHVGDSTSDGLVDPNYLPNPADRIDAQYRRVGATTEHIEITGGTSILETAEPGEVNTYQVASGLLSRGVRGCWVLALGTNDTADVFVGSALDRVGRIDKMMTLLAGQPVLWVNVKTRVGAGPYAEANMQAWNAAVLQACARYPTMRIYDWASAVRDSWFISDGIHYTSYGYAQRARHIADALVHAFPAVGYPHPGCVVS